MHLPNLNWCNIYKIQQFKTNIEHNIPWAVFKCEKDFCHQIQDISINKCNRYLPLHILHC